MCRENCRHIRRTSAYAESLAKALRDKGHYKDILTKDYIRNLSMAAPMHDIGKISIPDAMPLERCFEIIEEGKGTDFDPLLAEIFLDMREHVICIHESVEDPEEQKKPLTRN